MDRNILIFIFILVILFIGHVFLNESFYDISDNFIIDNQSLSTLKSEIISDISQSLNNTLAASNVMTDSCIDGIIDDQSADFMRYIPGKNPDDYIRKDSIPCYGCSVY
jgi:hypothetical protein